LDSCTLLLVKGIIERAAGTPAPVAAVVAPTPTYAPQQSRDAPRPDTRGWKREGDDDDDDDRRRYSSDGYKPKKKKSLLGELFDV
jgi:hypothetical protein